MNKKELKEAISASKKVIERPVSPTRKENLESDIKMYTRYIQRGSVSSAYWQSKLKSSLFKHRHVDKWWYPLFFNKANYVAETAEIGLLIMFILVVIVFGSGVV